ncbi:MAG: hypothetical protein Q8902_02940 [Bacteroidota bacterium]|nr:hypothetical protein [Bacteroidota bacterium]MDP4232565.1 hypothetical protein [Bacteroidota bacterium]MDP4242981.1 hypothetical protein [Bacteroidota bacterium]
MLRRLLVFSALLLVIAPSVVSAQWSALKVFSAWVESVYFQDQVGVAQTGFVGLSDGEIWRTTDNGVTWSATTTPGSSAIVKQFAFRDPNQGWCATDEGLWATTDGGLHWTAAAYAGNNIVSVGYNSTVSELIAVNWSNSASQSSDLGTNWSTCAPTQQNGVTFSGLNGVMSTFQSIQGFLYTTNGGQTWTPLASKLFTECWSPYGVPGTTMFFAIGEKTGQVFRSSDGGMSWSSTYRFTTPIPTGAIMGTLANLFVQTSNGFYCSTDQGTTWHSVCGPPNSRDTRFYSKGKEIFAGDGARTLWYNPDGTGSSSTLSIDNLMLRMTGARCHITDSMIRLTMSGICTGGVLTKAQILSGAPSFFVGLVNLPKIMIGRDSIAVGYTPSKSLLDSGKLLLEFNTGTKIIDTIISLYGTGQYSSNYGHVAQLSMVSPYACITKDTMLVITNLSCDSLTVTSASLSDTSHFQLLPTPASSNLPKVLGPSDTAVVAVTVSSSTDGTFTSRLRLVLTTDAGTQIFDTIPLRLDVTQGAQALFGALDLALLNRCVAMDTAFEIGATPCDSIVLLAASLSDTSVFHLAPISLPSTIAASGSIALPIHLVPQPKGIYATLLHVRYLSGHRLVDTTITLTDEVKQDIPILTHFSDSTLDMGTVSVPCEESARTLWLTNPVCRDYSITGLAWDPPDSEYSFDSLSFPLTIASLDSTQIRVHFKPLAPGQSTRMLRITLNLDGKSIDTVIPVTALGISNFRDTLLTPTLRFDTLLQCQQQDLEGDLINLSCDSIVALSTLLGDTLNFEILSPSFPYSLGARDTLHVKVRLKPNRSGALTDSAVVMVHDPVTGRDYPRTILLSGYVKPITHKLSIDTTSITLTAIPPCGSADSSVMLVNLGTCDDIIIQTVTVTGYPGITLTPEPMLPLVMHPGDSAGWYFQILPNEDSMEVSQIHFSGPNIDTTITLMYASLPGAHKLEFSQPDTVFPVRPCQTITKSYWLTSTGCDTVILDTLKLASGAVRFALGNVPVLPHTLHAHDTLRFTVQYDPDSLSNADSALLSIGSKQGRFERSVLLVGDVRGAVPTARIGIRANDLTQSISSHAGTPVSMKVMAFDGIGDSSALQTVSLEIHYNGNLLTMSGITVPAGWSILDSVEKPSGQLRLTLRHDAGGAVAFSSVLAEIFFSTTLGDSAATDITLTGLQFNSNDASYARCILTSLATPESVRYSTIDVCGNPKERALINNNLTMEIVSLGPNPAAPQNGAAYATLTLALSTASNVSIHVRDMLGRDCFQSNSSLEAGIQRIPLELSGLSEGAYFITVEASNMSGQSRQGRKLLVRSE